MIRFAAFFVASILLSSGAAFAERIESTDTIVLRGHPQILHLYGPRGGRPVVVSSGDGGWIHLAPHVAETLAARGFFVVGFDVKAYLSSFTTTRGALDASLEPDDYLALARYAQRGSSIRPLLIGVSEGAGLSILAASAPTTKAAILGVIGLGLPDMNELGWRWKDSLIYVTHAHPNEPMFSAATFAERMAPVPLAAIHSTHDEYVPLSEVQRVLGHAATAKRLWIVNAANHSFSDNLSALDDSLADAIGWVDTHAH
jgi:hypothetical protein